MSTMKRLFQLMAEKKASDIFLSVGSPINIKINGLAMPINQQAMDANTVRSLLYEVIDDKQRKEYEDTLELNTAYTLQGVGSFRISGFRQKGSPAVVVRYIPNTIPPLDSLGLPPILKDIILEKRGLILMVGATGPGNRRRSRPCSTTATNRGRAISSPSKNRWNSSSRTRNRS